MSFSNKYLDGEKLFTVYWIELGNARSYQQLQNWCANNKVFSPKTGKVPFRMTLWKAMYRWAVNNSEKAFKIINEGLVDSGENIDWQRWEKELKEKALTSHQHPPFTRRWAKHMGYDKE